MTMPMSTTTTLSDAYAEDPVHLPHHQHHHFDLNSASHVPDSHTWPPHHDQTPVADEPAPVIDLRNPMPTVLAQIANACESWGVFQLVGHGLPTHLFDLVDSELRRLFSLPIEQKLKALRPPDGLTGYGVVPISSHYDKLLWSEGFTLIGSPVDDIQKLWPEDYRRFCDVIEEYKEEMGKLAKRLMAVFFASLGLSEEEEAEWAGPGFEDGSPVLRLNSYPACPEPDKAIGMMGHTDSSLFTMLYQSNTIGLQGLRAADEQAAARWVTVPPIRGALVVNIGDLFQILSNGRYRSLVHRVVVNQSEHRVTIGYFHGPPANAKLSPMKGLGHDSLYREVTWAEYLSLKLKHLDKTMEVIKVEKEQVQDEDDD